MDTSNLQHDAFPSSDQLRYECWTRISRDATTFPILHNDAQFEHWLVKFKAKLDANGINTTTFLDPYWPDNALTEYPKGLHDKQCAFFWTLLQHVFQGDFSSSCVLYHQWTRDGCQAYFDFVEFHNPVSPPTPPAAPVSSPGPVPVRPPAVGNIVMPQPTPPVSPLTSVPIPSSTPTVHQSTPTSACETDVHSTVDNSETPTGIPGSSNPGSTADSTSTGTSTYTWKYSPSTDSIRFSKVDPSSTPSIVHTGIPTGDVPSKRNREPHSTHARPSCPSPANSRWKFYPQSETVVFHRTQKPVSLPQSTCIPSLQLSPSGALSKDSAVPSSVYAYSQHGASSYPVQKPLKGAHPRQLYGAHHSMTVQKPLNRAHPRQLHGAHHSMTYVLPAVCITKRHRDAIKIKLYQLHATLVIANWLYDDVT
eukprot:jgi/Psemu1/30059/gm1.30059_g